jgi:hypothetical protein
MYSGIVLVADYAKVRIETVKPCKGVVSWTVGKTQDSLAIGFGLY